MKGAIRAGDRWVLAAQVPNTPRWEVKVVDDFGNALQFGEYASEADAQAAKQDAIGSYRIPPTTIPR